MNPRLEIVVEIFVGVEVRGIRRQVKQLDLVGVLIYPFAHEMAVMHSEVIQDQINLAIAIADQALEETDQTLCGHRLGKQHESHLPPVGNR